MLVMQCDTIICSNSPHKIHEYLGYDYIGAPWPGLPHLLGGNGGNRAEPL